MGKRCGVAHPKNFLPLRADRDDYDFSDRTLMKDWIADTRMEEGRAIVV